MNVRALKSVRRSSAGARPRPAEGVPDPRASELERRLLEVGGRRVVLPPVEPHLGALLERGRVIPAGGSRLQRMQRSRCHSNAAELWQESGGCIRIGTGYALSDDGLWRRHSWGLERGRVVETTVEHELYFGVELDVEGSRVFGVCNPPQRVEEQALEAMRRGDPVARMIPIAWAIGMAPDTVRALLEQSGDGRVEPPARVPA